MWRREDGDEMIIAGQTGKLNSQKHTIQSKMTKKKKFRQFCKIKLIFNCGCFRHFLLYALHTIHSMNMSVVYNSSRAINSILNR